MANVEISRIRSFNTCGPCPASDAVANMEVIKRGDFGNALRFLQDLDDGYDDCGANIAVTQEEVDIAARSHEMSDQAEALGLCFQAMKTGACNRGKPEELKVNREFL